jgi:hypothetical protein
LAAIYVDAVCRHNDIRIMIIGRYLRLVESPFRGYELMVSALRKRFYLERIALDGSSFLVSAGILAVGLWRWFATSNGDDLLPWIEMLSGTLGVVGTALLVRPHKKQLDELDGYSDSQIRSSISDTQRRAGLKR